MNLARIDEQALTFHLEENEYEFLAQTFDSYPVVPAAHHSLSKDSTDPRAAEFQLLLDEAIAGQRAENKKHLRQWIDKPGRFKEVPEGCEFTLERTDLEWFLQVLNDIRVGSWLLLGSPEERLDHRKVSHKLLPAWVSMELCGFLQSVILQALNP